METGNLQQDVLRNYQGNEFNSIISYPQTLNDGQFGPVAPPANAPAVAPLAAPTAKPDMGEVINDGGKTSGPKIKRSRAVEL